MTGPDGSVLGRLRERRAELAADHRLDLAIPGYGGELVARYRPLTAEEQRHLAAKVDRADHASEAKAAAVQMMVAVDTIVAACDEILVMQDGGLVPLAAIAGAEGPVRFDEQLAEALGIDADTAREVVCGLFPRDRGGQVLPQPVNRHANEVAVWMARIGIDADAGLLGEA